MDTPALVVAAARADQGAWDALVRQFSGLLWSIARAYRLSDDDAADAVQCTWIKLVENLERIAEPERLGGWLAGTARHECLRLLRRSGRLPEPVMNDDDFLDVVRGAADESDPVPAGVLRDASAALALRTIDAELAELVEGPLAFASDRVTVSLEISDGVVRGLVTGAEGDAVVETPHSRRAAPLTDGWFTVTEVPSGLVRVRVTASDGTPVVTRWARG